MNKAIISTKGQVVIPNELREKYHLHPRSIAVWIDLGGVLALAPQYENVIENSRGMLVHSKLDQKLLRKNRKMEKTR